MSKTSQSNTCTFVCWLIAALIGLLCAYFIWSGVGALAALLIGAVLAVLVGLALTQLFCRAGVQAMSMAAATGAGAREATSQADSGKPNPHPVGAAPAQADTEAGAAPSALQPVAVKAKGVKAEAEQDSANAGRDAGGASSSDGLVSTSAAMTQAKAAAKAKRKPKGETPKMSAGGKATPSVSTAGGAVMPSPGAKVSDAANETAGIPSGDAKGTRPEALSGPRDGGADDLKKIKGVGPKLESRLHDLGFYHFDQIAKWNDAEVAWVDENLKGFKGRVSRDNWVSQAATLAEGGETEFSKRVGKGDVY